MQLTVDSFENGKPIPSTFAFGMPADDGPVQLAPNRSPHLHWTDLPAETRSLAIICHDPDVPSQGDDVNQEGRTVPYDLPRVDFFHWVLVDIPITVNELPEGIDSDGVTPKGKDLGKTEYGVRGRNDYTGWFAGDPDMAGDYGGYDGPCPPWNDERLHHYVFTLYALDVPTLGLEGVFGGAEARDAMQGHILAEAGWVGTYAIYPDAV